MIVLTEFPGDTNENLKMVQHGVYGEALLTIFECARDRYQSESRLIGIETELLRLVAPLRTLDHRVLQQAHDRIASQFRYVHSDSQQNLFATKEEYEKELRHAWLDFVREAAAAIALDDSMNIAVLEAIAYANEEKGLTAEDRLVELLEQRYGKIRGALRWATDRNGLPHTRGYSMSLRPSDFVENGASIAGPSES